MPALILSMIMSMGCCFSAFATEAAPDAEPSNWFFYVGTGFSPYPQHDSALQQQIGQAHADGLWSFVGGQMEFPGIYHRVGDNRIVGVLGSALLEEYGRDRRDNRRLAIRSLSAVVSMMEFFKPTIGEGYYYRVDAGLQTLQIVSETATATTATHDIGAIVQVGFGYGFEFFHVGHALIQAGPYLSTAGSHTLWGGLLQLGVLL